MSQHISAAQDTAQIKSQPVLSRSPQSALDIVEPELVEALSHVSEQLDIIVAQSLNDEAPAQALSEKLATQLDEVAGVFTMLNLSAAADLSVQLGLAVKQVCQSQHLIEEREYQALFQCAYLLPRFFEYVQATGVTSPLLLAPSFYALASAGLAPFAAESELIEFDYQVLEVSPSDTGASESPSTGLSLVPVNIEIAGSNIDVGSSVAGNSAGVGGQEIGADVIANLGADLELQSEPFKTASETASKGPGESASKLNPEAKSKTFRRLRQMYQTGLIGMLRDDNVSAKLVLLNRVAERCVSLCNGSPVGAVWRVLQQYINAAVNAELELTPQRRHFFAKFDRTLKALEKDPAAAMTTLPERAVLRELTLLMLLIDADNVNNADLLALGNFSGITWTDKAVVDHREAMERSTHKALLTMLEVIKEELVGGKRILDMISESGICENDDIDTLVKNCERISAVLKVGGFDTATKVIDESIDKIILWRGATPDQEELLGVANMMLYLENALLTGSLNECGQELDKDSTVARGLLQQAQLDLFEESKANIGLAKRAVTSYIESNFDREHIANVSVSLETIAGAFSMVDIESAQQLMQRCAELISAEYSSQSSNDSGTDAALLESLADALVSVEYLLDELASGRGMDSGSKKLVDESLKALV